MQVLTQTPNLLWFQYATVPNIKPNQTMYNYVWFLHHSMFPVPMNEWHLKKSHAMWSLCPHLPGEETHHFSKTPHFSLGKITSQGQWPSNVLSGSQCVLGYFECPGNLVLSDSEPRPHSCIDWSCPCPSPHSPGLSATQFSSWGLKRKEISETKFVPRKSANNYSTNTSHDI